MPSLSRINVQIPVEGEDPVVEQYDIDALRLVDPISRNPYEVGSATVPVYFADGHPVPCEGGGGGGTGGSNVTITPNYRAGNLVAKYTIDGVAGSLYSPKTNFVYKRVDLWTGTLSDVGDNNTNNPFKTTIGNYNFLLVHYAPSNNINEERTMMFDALTFVNGIATNNAIFSCHYLSDVFIKVKFNSQDKIEVVESRTLPLSDGENPQLLKCVIKRIEGLTFGVSGEDMDQGLTVRRILWGPASLDEVGGTATLKETIESYNYIYVHYCINDNLYDEKILILDKDAVLRGLEQNPSAAYFNCYVSDNLYIKGLFTTTTTLEVTEVQEDLEHEKKCIIRQIDGICMGSVATIGEGGDISTCMIKGVDYVTAGVADGASIGDRATVEGWENGAIGNYSHAEGFGNTAGFIASHAEGNETFASNNYSHTEGSNTKAFGVAAHAEGISTCASYNASHTEGTHTIAAGNNAHAEGYYTYAYYGESHAEGGFTTAYGQASHTEGWKTKSSGLHSHAEGYYTCAYGNCSHTEGVNTYTNGYYTHAEGVGALALGWADHAEGNETTACSNAASALGGNHAEGWRTYAGVHYANHAEGYITTAGGVNTCVGAHAEGYRTYTIDSGSHAEGYKTTATKQYAHAEGYKTCSYGKGSHTEGVQCTAVGSGCHVEGYKTYARNSDNLDREYESKGSHAEGHQTTALGEASHAEGYITLAKENGTHAEGWCSSALGSCSHAEGYSTTAAGTSAHAEGNCNLANSGNDSGAHAEGCYTTAINGTAHSEGWGTYASGYASHAGGYRTTATNYASCSIGKVTQDMTNGGSQSNQVGTAFIIGNGYLTGASRTSSNAFTVMYNGSVSSLNTQNNPGQDYAENFEWSDNNINEEDRVGYFVTFDEDDKIRIANSNDDYILGIVSGSPSVLGNSDCDVWNQMYLRDNFNRFLEEDAPLYEINPETGETEPVLDDEGNQVYQGKRFVLNPNYDSSQEYVRRSERPEWAPVGMLGVLPVRDDGTCQVNKYCKVNDNGIATYQATYNKNENYYRVIERVAENIVKVVFR